MSVLVLAVVASVPKYGISYLHLQTLAAGADAQGTYFRGFAQHSAARCG